MFKEGEVKKHIFSVTKKDLTVQTFQSGGKGGQHQNKTNSGVRIIHKASGAVGECRNHKSQYQNKKEAFVRLSKDKRFMVWVRFRAFGMSNGKSIDEMVEEQMDEKNLKIEVMDSKKWVKYGDSK